jgi:hypothetical protein
MPAYTHKTARTTGLTTGTVIIQTDTTIDPFPTAVGQLTLVSTSAQDKSGGTGVVNVQVRGLYEDASGDYVEFTDTVEMDGTDAVTVTATSWDPTKVWRVFRIRALDTGFTGTASNVGTIAASVGGTVIAEIDAARGQTEMATWSNGNDHTARLKRWWARLLLDTAGTATAELTLWRRVFGGPWVALDTSAVTLGEGQFDIHYEGLGKKLAINTDLKIEATWLAGSMSLAAGMEIRRTPQSYHQ